MGRCHPPSFDLVAQSRADVARLSIPLPRPPGKTPPFAPIRRPADQESQSNKASAGDLESSSIHHATKEMRVAGQAHKEHAPGKGKRKTPRSQQAVGPRTTPNPGATPPLPPTAATHATTVPDDVPWPRSPPKPNLEEWSCPGRSSRVVDALAAQAATMHNQNFVPRWIADAILESLKGKPTLLMQPQPLLAVYPFTPTPNKWQHGIEVNYSPDWAWEVIEAAVVFSCPQAPSNSIYPRFN